MKKSLLPVALFIAALVGALVSSSSAAENFEGRMKLKMQPAKGDAQLLTYALKGQRMRMEIPTGKETMVGLVDWNKREMSMLMPGQAMYMVIEMKDLPVMEELQKAQESTNLEKTSETAKIVGRDTTKYIARDGKDVTDLWLASGIGAWRNMGGGGNPMGGKKLKDWEKEIISKGLFPLRTVTYEKGKPSMTMEVVEMVPEKLDESLFVPPANYQRFSIGGMLKGLGGK